jgi:hypothetical protein
MTYVEKHANGTAVFLSFYIVANVYVAVTALVSK